MRQVWIPRTGGPEVLEVREAPDPTPGADQVRIRVAASGVNFADILARLGLYPDAPKPPLVVGYEVAGVVDRVGDRVSGLAEGDRVLALTRFGGYSDVVCAHHQLVAHIPDGLGFDGAASIPINWLTAWIMLVRLGGVRAGDRVLVHAAAGGVGQAAVQICRHRGAEVIGTASPVKHERLAALGVAHCIDYRAGDFVTEVSRITGGRGVDIALDAIGGDSFARSYRCLASLGRLFVYGVSSFAPSTRRNLVAALTGLWRTPTFKPIPLMNHNRGVLGVNLGHLWDRGDELRAMLHEIITLFADGVFQPVVDRSFAFDEAPAAHLYIQQRKNFGKVVLAP
ncbi:MAG: zinc-binding dehydrogenase [Thermoanaerobaculales bacterium]|jgi:NADPH:quinone reductase-like Zn-dependent oxidoreductase|nr:zinc-binding dehydrogenase [Thermoanaerobaculales bacterium]